MSDEFQKLLTGKPHVSFSELKSWRECSWRHKKQHVEKLNLDKPSPIPGFGTACHATLEHFGKTRVMDVRIAFDMIKKMFDDNAGVEGFDPDHPEDGIEAMCRQAADMLAEVPAFLDETFPSWEFLFAEFPLYEPIAGQPHAFKGFIDFGIKATDSRGRPIVWVLDFKTTRSHWKAEKKADPMIQAQLGLYKHFWSQRSGFPLKDIRCGFVLLKRRAKKGQHVELVSVSLGEKPIGRALSVINNMVFSVQNGVAIKHTDQCMWCPYKDTEHCVQTVKILRK